MYDYVYHHILLFIILMILFIAICEQNYKLNHKMEGCHWFW